MERLAVILCTFDRPDALAATLRDAIAQAPAGSEIVVIDQSRPAAREQNRRAAGALGVRYVALAEPGLPRARNVGLAATTAPVVLFLDDDVRLMPGCLQAHLRAYERPGVGGVVGRIVERSVRANAPVTANFVAAGGRVLTNLWGTRRSRIDTLKGANMSMRREALVAIGGFDPSYQGTALLEDADVSERLVRAGWELWFEPEAELVHLSAPRGGVRVGSERDTERWRFHNTAYFMRRHRGRAGAARGLATFAAVAAARAITWRDPGALPALLRAYASGWALARRDRWPDT